MKVGVVLPSYYDGEDWESGIIKLRDSLHYINSIDNLHFLINFQCVPDDKFYIAQSLINQIVAENTTWECSYRVNGKYTPVSMVRIRNDCMTLDRTCDVYMFMDDDYVFREKSAEQYQFVIDSFEKDPNLGLVMCAGSLGGYNYVGVLKYDYAKFWMTSKGLFLRNINRSLSSPIYPDSLLEYHVGGYEESIASIEIFKAGLKMATYFNCSTYLPRASHIEPDREVPDDIHNFALSSKSVEDYIMKEFGCRYPITDARCIPQFVRSLYKRGLGYRYE